MAAEPRPPQADDGAAGSGPYAPGVTELPPPVVDERRPVYSVALGGTPAVDRMTAAR